MNRRTDNERLLADVIADESEAGFHEALLGETLRLVRRRRRFRQARRTAMVTVLLAGLALLVWQRLPTRIVAPGAEEGSYAIIRTQPLPPSALVTTRPFPAGQLVASIAMKQVVETSSARRLYRDVDDDELLAMLSPKVAALVRLGPNREELIVLDQAGPETPPPN
jgi:hypothetical protein